MAFQNCRNITSVVIPNSVNCIDDYAFAECNSLISVTIPNSVTSIESFAFQGCLKLKEISYTGTKAQWKNIKIKKDCITKEIVIKCLGESK